MRFEKISLDEWCNYWESHWPHTYPKEEIVDMYEHIQLPKAGSPFAAGHDFYIPLDVIIPANCKALLPTGIRWVTVEEDKDKFLMIVPRSGLGTKFGMRLTNTVGIIDADYCLAANEGHIMASVVVDKELVLNAGDRFMQGILMQYYRCGEASNTTRSGGFGSTGVK